eukprot:7664783-Pyramimonas_sp.AAC.1
MYINAGLGRRAGHGDTCAPPVAPRAGPEGRPVGPHIGEREGAGSVREAAGRWQRLARGRALGQMGGAGPLQ